MPKSVQLTNLNPNADYPVCRFQVVDHTEEAKRHIGDDLTSSTYGKQPVSRTGTTAGANPSMEAMAASQAIAQMHQRATELLNQLIERRQMSQKSTTRSAWSRVSSRSQPSESRCTAQTNLCKIHSTGFRTQFSHILK
ncbi:unnamed protein product [Echinostoma caproni]|uniref:Retrotransposon gag protein n=1 Tax=Echinostoma caproni TaxID=27848 RepID=A0A183ABN6_9TREM|nr:unnamed protein product [Echinostoma caproni]